MRGSFPNANFTKANLKTADLSGADLRRASSTSDPRQASRTQPTANARISPMDWSSSPPRDQLHRRALRPREIRKAELKRATFLDAVGEDVSFADAKLQEVDCARPGSGGEFQARTFRRPSFASEPEDVSFAGARFAGADASEAQGKGSTLSGGSLPRQFPPGEPEARQLHGARASTPISPARCDWRHFSEANSKADLRFARARGGLHGRRSVRRRLANAD